MTRRLDRRTFLTAATTSAAALLTGCEVLGLTEPTASGSARLSARPGAPTSAGPLGLHPLGLGNALADGMVYVPASYTTTTPAPLVLLLHGAGGVASNFITPFVPVADETGQILLAVDSRKVTWDGVGNGRFGPDIAFLDLALRDTFAKYAVDAQRVAIGGFSDGATMSLALGLANGDLFSRVMVWSAGGVITRERRGHPAFFVTHGTYDPVISVRVCQDDTLPALRRGGYDVTYREFAGGHMLPDDLRRDAMAWAAT
ncbi:MAG: phospholipase [Gemmatimonadetes bacterium]|nr:phospholipase [Gemmatimonadota bacterium]